VKYRRRLTPTQKRILHLLIDQDSTAETSAEIATALGLTKDSVDHQLSSVYAQYGVRSARGLFRCLDSITAELGK
jgi:DNA-binding CsgD family transcriptional regulator